MSNTKIVRETTSRIDKKVEELVAYINSPECTPEKRKRLQAIIAEELDRVKAERETSRRVRGDCCKEEE